tara:strand:- start:1056 stop:1286 length:231 start_codon:yes stop_codon:yes gene_type:complete
MNKSNKNRSYRQRVRERIESGRYEEHKGLSICKINDFYRLPNGKIKYQVHSYYFSQLYEDIDEALDKFFEIRRKIR